MEKTIAKIEYVVGWSTKQNNTHIRRTTNRFGESEYNKAYSKYLWLTNRDRVIFCYMNQRTEYTDGLVKIEKLFFF